MYPRPSDNGHLNITLMQGFQDLGQVSDSQPPNQEMMGWLNDESNPSLNLPYKVLFPSVASDVVAAIEFAKEHDLEISIKNSKSSYWIGRLSLRSNTHKILLQAVIVIQVHQVRKTLSS